MGLGPSILSLPRAKQLLQLRQLSLPDGMSGQPLPLPADLIAMDEIGLLATPQVGGDTDERDTFRKALIARHDQTLHAWRLPAGSDAHLIVGANSLSPSFVRRCVACNSAVTMVVSRSLSALLRCLDDAPTDDAARRRLRLVWTSHPYFALAHLCQPSSLIRVSVPFPPPLPSPSQSHGRLLHRDVVMATHSRLAVEGDLLCYTDHPGLHAFHDEQVRESGLSVEWTPARPMPFGAITGVISPGDPEALKPTDYRWPLSFTSRWFKLSPTPALVDRCVGQYRYGRPHLPSLPRSD